MLCGWSPELLLMVFQLVHCKVLCELPLLAVVATREKVSHPTGLTGYQRFPDSHFGFGVRPMRVVWPPRRRFESALP